jgi:hypothetical protein
MSYRFLKTAEGQAALRAWGESLSVHVDEPLPKDVWLEAWEASIEQQGLPALKDELSRAAQGTADAYVLKCVLLDLGLAATTVDALVDKLRS